MGTKAPLTALEPSSFLTSPSSLFSPLALDPFSPKALQPLGSAVGLGPEVHGLKRGLARGEGLRPRRVELRHVARGFGAQVCPHLPQQRGDDGAEREKDEDEERRANAEV